MVDLYRRFGGMHCLHLQSRQAYSSTMELEATWFSEAAVKIDYTNRHNILGDRNCRYTNRLSCNLLFVNRSDRWILRGASFANCGPNWVRGGRKRFHFACAPFWLKKRHDGVSNCWLWGTGRWRCHAAGRARRLIRVAIATGVWMTSAYLQHVCSEVCAAKHISVLQVACLAILTNQLTHWQTIWNWVLPEEPIVAHRLEFPAFYVTRSSLPCPQKTAICPYPALHKFSLHLGHHV
jgi:hypothetical protein